jgi:hypothetical protein
MNVKKAISRVYSSLSGLTDLILPLTYLRESIVVSSALRKTTIFVVSYGYQSPKLLKSASTFSALSSM